MLGRVICETLALALVSMNAANYTAASSVIDGVETILLEDNARRTEVRIARSIGNIAYSMRVNGTEVFWSPSSSLAEWKAKPGQRGNPFLAPWANRIEGLKYWVNGREHTLDPKVGNLRLDGNGNPIHGLAIFTDQWKPVETKADENAAWTTSRLAFAENPSWMKQFPFGHAITMTYRLSGGELEVITEIENQGKEAMPVAIGYHPWFQIPGGRNSWSIHIAAKEHVELSDKLIPTGKRTPKNWADPFPLKDAQQDDVYTSLERNGKGQAEFWVTNGKQKLSVLYGPKYPVAVVYAPPGRDVVCFEPMAGVTDAFNQHHKGQYPELQSIPPGQRWRESFWIRPQGF